MRRYIALLRGVNISGKNKVPMAELKLGFESLGFPDVRTWLNSGNVVFSGEEAEPAALTVGADPAFAGEGDCRSAHVDLGLDTTLPPASFQTSSRDRRAEGGA